MAKFNLVLILFIVVGINSAKSEQQQQQPQKKQEKSSVTASIAVNGLKPLPLKLTHKRQVENDGNKKSTELVLNKFGNDFLKYLELNKFNKDLITNDYILNNDSEFDNYDEDRDGDYELNDEQYQDEQEYYDQYSKSKRSWTNGMENSFNEKKKVLPLEKYKKLLINLIRQKSSPIDPESFAKYMNEFYLKHHNSYKPNSGNTIRPFKGSGLPITKESSSSKELNAAYLLQKMKRAACGNLNGNPMHKWICW